MYIKQLSIFLENRKGSLQEALKLLGENDIDLVALSVADTTEYGILRLIVSDPDAARSILKKNGFMAQVTAAVAIRVDHETGSLYKALEPLQECVNIEYMYAFANGEDASAVLKCDDMEKAVSILQKNGVRIWAPEEAYQLNRMR